MRYLLFALLFLSLSARNQNPHHCGRDMSTTCDICSPCGIKKSDCYPQWFHRDGDSCYFGDPCDSITVLRYNPLPNLPATQAGQDFAERNLFYYSHGNLSFPDVKIQCYRFVSPARLIWWQMWVESQQVCSGATLGLLAVILFDAQCSEVGANRWNYWTTPGEEYSLCLLWAPSTSCTPHRKTYPFIYHEREIRFTPVVKQGKRSLDELWHVWTISGQYLGVRPWKSLPLGVYLLRWESTVRKVAKI